MFRMLFLMLCFVLPLCAAEKKKVCLNMIVKNESHVIKRCLGSVKPFIDYWVIQDNGSTDGTQQVIKEFMKDIPGEVVETSWVNFEHNRNEALEAARGKCDYILVMDADDFLETPPGYQLPSLVADSYQIQIRYGGMTYARKQLIKASLPWQWKGVVHEVLTCDAPHSCEMLEGVQYVITQDGARSKDPKKYYKDAALLEEALKKDPTSTRYTFYLAQSYRDAGESQKSLEWYQKRIAMGGWDEEVYVSMVQVAKLQEALHMPVDAVLTTLEQAHRFRPHRVEALYYLVELLNQEGKYDLAYAHNKTREFIRQPEKKDVLFTQDWMEEYGLLFQLSISSYYLGRYKESVDACESLLAMENFPWKECAAKNEKFSLEKMQQASAAATQKQAA